MTLPRIQTPFIIWTLQRTGGTNLNNCLHTLSDNPRLQDEAFNPDRKFGYATAAWKQTEDRTALREAVAKVHARRYNLKHCPELVPWPVSSTLANMTARNGYGHLFLYRQNSLGRILSREYAIRTQIWGPQQAPPTAGKDRTSAFETPLDVQSAIRHETMAHTRLNRIWDLLLETGVTPVSISFEELYATDETVTLRGLKRVFSGLGVDLEPEDAEQVLTMIRARGDQNTRDLYERFKGVQRLEKRLDELPALRCHA